MSHRIQPLNYQPSNLEVGGVHIGLGNFARAFLGEYYHNVAQTGERAWGFVAVAPSDRQRVELQNLQRQGYIYHLLKRNGDEVCTRVGAMLGVMIAKFGPAAVVSRLANQTTKVVTLTVTQAGYCLDVNKELALTPEVQNDIIALREGQHQKLTTAPGWVTAALHSRFKQGALPFTTISCDNLPQNGQLLQRVVRSFAGEVSPEFLSYVNDNARFPNSVVDRVTPHQNYARNHGHLKAEYGVDTDAAPIVCEPYRKFVIEDAFPDGHRPPFNQIDDSKSQALFVPDVEPYEDRKLRLLNGSHLAIGLMGKLLQIPTVLEATADPDVRHFWLSFLTQAAEGLKPMAVDCFVRDTVHRLDNPHLTDQTDRLLASTASKIAVRLFNEPALRKGTPTDASAFALAVWLRYMAARDESGNPYNLHPNDLGKIEALGLDTTDGIRLNMPRILTKDQALAESPAMADFIGKILANHKLIRQQGVRQAMTATRFTTLPSFPVFDPKSGACDAPTVS